MTTSPAKHGYCSRTVIDLQQFGPLPLLTDIAPHSGGLMMDLGGLLDHRRGRGEDFPAISG
jgi:hypothetical protein